MRVLSGRKEGLRDKGGHGAFGNVPGDDGSGGEDEDIACREAGAFCTRWRVI